MTSGTPITTADVTAATNIYVTPYGGCNTVAPWDGSAWTPLTFSEITIALGTLTSGKPYDVFCYNSSSALACEILVWTSDTARATAVVWTEGRLTKSGAQTRLLMGTFYTTSTTTTEDSAAKRYVSNVYNAKTKHMASALETADSWNYSTASFQQANANTANQLNYIASTARYIHANAMSVGTQSGTNGNCGVGVGFDSTTTNSARITACFVSNTAGAVTQSRADYRAMPAEGRHFLAWLEQGLSATTTFYGDNGKATIFQTGIQGFADF